MIREKESSAKSLADAVAVAQDQLMESSGQAEALEEVATTLAKLKKDTSVQGADSSAALLQKVEDLSAQAMAKVSAAKRAESFKNEHQELVDKLEGTISGMVH